MPILTGLNIDRRQESQIILSPMNSGPWICVEFQISSKLKLLQLLFKTIVTIEFTTLRNYGLKDDRCQYRQESNLTGVENHKKQLPLLNSPPSLCVEYEISSKWNICRSLSKAMAWKMTGANIGRCQESQKTILSSMNSSSSNCSLCKISWKMVNLISCSPFPVPRSSF